MGDPRSVFLLGYHSVERNLQRSACGRHRSLAVEERYAALKLASAIPQLISR